MAAVVENNVETTASVVAAVSKPEAVENVSIVAQADGTAAVTKASTSSSSETAVDGVPSTFRGQSDDFYNAIFYFSGMGSVIGSALSEGVYVAEQYRKNAIDAEELQQDRQAIISKIRSSGTDKSGRGGQSQEDVVVKARGQAQHLSTDLQKLQTLLESLPVFSGNANQLTPTGGDKRAGEIDQPIHGELYFRCKERFPVQQPTSTPTPRQMQPSPHESLRSGASGDVSYQSDDVRRRRNYDDAVLADVARAAVDAFPLMPPPRQPSSRGSATPVQELQQLDEQASRRARRRDVNSSVTASSPSPSGHGYHQYSLEASQVY